MKKIGIALLALFFMASCNEKENKEIDGDTIQKVEIMQKEEKQKIEALLGEYKNSLNTSDAKLAQSVTIQHASVLNSYRESFKIERFFETITTLVSF